MYLAFKFDFGLKFGLFSSGFCRWNSGSNS